jgi:hypothetical protein
MALVSSGPLFIPSRAPSPTLILRRRLRLLFPHEAECGFRSSLPVPVGGWSSSSLLSGPDDQVWAAVMLDVTYITWPLIALVYAVFTSSENSLVCCSTTAPTAKCQRGRRDLLERALRTGKYAVFRSRFYRRSQSSPWPPSLLPERGTSSTSWPSPASRA